MKITRPYKILIGIGTIWYVLYPLLFIAVWFMMVFGMGLMPLLAGSGESPGSAPPFLMFPFFSIFPLHFCTIFIGLGLMVFYLIHVIRNTQADETIRIVLGVGCFFIPFIAMPIYYYLYIWLEHPPVWAAAKPIPAQG
jgi:hypothetical protein